MKSSSDCCDDHHTVFAPKKHPEFGSKGDKHLRETERGAAHPQHHTKGQMPSQLQPDHGPHR